MIGVVTISTKLEFPTHNVLELYMNNRSKYSALSSFRVSCYLLDAIECSTRSEPNSNQVAIASAVV